MCKTGLKTT